tara:strand:+ start:725 stop:1594 length:870 start_codon:yes stop_codon:yes gene_type:complete
MVEKSHLIRNRIKLTFYSFLKEIYLLFVFFLKTRKGTSFTFFFNLRSAILKKGVKVKYKKGIYKIYDKNFPKIVKTSNNESTLFSFYKNGFYRRAVELERCYQLDKIKFKNKDIIIDCGANHGDLKLWFDLNNIEISYVGFEPDPREFENLKRNIFPSEVHNLGLWNEDSENVFYISRFNADSSFFEPISYEKKIIVPSKRLSSFINEPVRLLKLEAEGAEPEIIYGIGEKINLIEYITADVGFERGLKEESTLAPVTNHLLENNFEVVGVGMGRLSLLFRNKIFRKLI